jgi:ribonuclease HI
LNEAKVVSVEIYGDSELVIKQLNGQYEELLQGMQGDLEKFSVSDSTTYS